jgi:hypothetical protein
VKVIFLHYADYAARSTNFRHRYKLGKDSPSPHRRDRFEQRKPRTSHISHPGRRSYELWRRECEYLI